MRIYLYILILINILSFIDLIKINRKIKNSLYIFTIFLLSLISGFRGEVGTDTLNYITAYNSIKNITINSNEVLNIYTDKLFIFISSVIKILFSNLDLYFFIISLTSMLFIFISLYKITKYVFIGLLVYYIRFFFLRDMNQIRAGLSIAIIMFSITYIKEKGWQKFIKLNLISVLIHKSTIVWLITYFFARQKFSKTKVILIIIFSILINILIYKEIDTIGKILELIGINSVYIDGEFGLKKSLGYKNPILYYQFIIFLMFLYFEKILIDKFEYYNIIKNIYLISLVVLIIFMPWSSIAGRISTIFATVEIFIIPSFMYAFKNKVVINFVLLIILNLIAYYNIFMRLGVEYIYF